LGVDRTFCAVFHLLSVLVRSMYGAWSFGDSTSMSCDGEV
jgi:hypothetical protein